MSKRKPVDLLLDNNGESRKKSKLCSSPSDFSESEVGTCWSRNDADSDVGNDNNNKDQLPSKSKCLRQTSENTKWRHYQRENLSLDYTTLYSHKNASELIKLLEKEINYNVGQLAQVRIFGKWMNIPRKQAAFGESGLTYTFSGNTVPACPWTPLLLQLRDDVSRVSGYEFNFVLVNRYQNGHDYMGEHKDDEKDLCSDYPIASLSLGQTRDFVFKHQDSRGKNAKRPDIEKFSIQLESGSLLLMNAPTNSFWYHSLPKRPKALGVRLNFTFRKMVPSKCKPVKS